jgi:hypothetical protein
LDFSASVFLFEFEVLNSAFHTVDGQPFKKLSFLNIKANRKWGAFDAFMIVPAVKQTPERKGALVGFESKLGSDTSRNTKGLHHVNQIMRNLEAGYWLTHHQGSLYRGWEFHYVFVSPRRDFEWGTSYYSYLLRDCDEKMKAADNYRRIVNHHGAVVDEEGFSEFKVMVAERTWVLHWDEIAGALSSENPTFFSDYMRSLSASPGLVEVLEATVQRFRFAGLDGLHNGVTESPDGPRTNQQPPQNQPGA